MELSKTFSYVLLVAPLAGGTVPERRGIEDHTSGGGCKMTLNFALATSFID